VSIKKEAPGKSENNGLYSDGQYETYNPGWHEGDSGRKAQELFGLLDRHRKALRFAGSTMQCCEVGCGYGGVLAELVFMFARQWGVECQAVGVDISPLAIAQAEERHGGEIKFVVGDINQIPRQNDLLIAADVVEHLASPGAFLQQLCRKAPYVLFRFPLEKNLWNSLPGKKKILERRLGHLHFYRWKGALALLTDNGFSIVDYDFTNNFSSPAHCKTAIAKIMAPVRGALSAVSQKMNSQMLGGNSLVVLALGTQTR